MKSLILGLLLLASFISRTVVATTNDWDNWQDEPASPWTINGVLNFAAGHFSQDNVTEKQFSLQELRAELAVDYQGERFKLTQRLELSRDWVTNESDFEWRELHVAGRLTPWLDVKLGKQVLTWGTGDLVFVNDVFAKDWQSFFAGRDETRLKAPATSLRATAFIDAWSIDLAYTPDFTTDNFITGQRFSFYDLGSQQQVAPGEIGEQRPNGDQLALRIARTFQSTEFALYYSDGYWSIPNGINAAGRPYFPTLRTLGASLRSPLGAGIAHAEIAYYQSRDDDAGNLPTVPNSQYRGVIGYEQELLADLTMALQLYSEYQQDYQQLIANSIWPEFEGERIRTRITARLTYRTMQQKLTWSLFNFYSLSDNDNYLRLSVSYRQSDKWQFTTGANLFSGQEEYSFFGQHEDNSNLWLRIKYQY